MAKNKMRERLNALEQEIKSIRSELENSRFKGLKVGDKFKLLELEWKILDVTDVGYVCLAERLEDNRRFDSASNNWESSDLRNYLNIDIYKQLCEEIGADNIVEFERDLLSLDGHAEYGTCIDRVSIISFDEYRKYRNLIPNAEYWWWTITPDSTKCNGDTKWIRVVSPSGSISSNSYDCSLGVRPFCIFESTLFESE